MIDAGGDLARERAARCDKKRLGFFARYPA